MPKLPVLKARIVEKILLKAGFELIHSQGSHKTYHNKLTQKTTTVPFHSKDVATGTLRSIIKQSGLSKDDFIKLK